MIQNRTYEFLRYDVDQVLVAITSPSYIYIYIHIYIYIYIYLGLPEYKTHKKKHALYSVHFGARQMRCSLSGPQNVQTAHFLRQEFKRRYQRHDLGFVH